MKIIFGTFLECFILVDYYFLHFERDCVHAVNDFYNLWTIPHFVDISTFCRQFHTLWTVSHFVDNSTFCGQFNILWTVPHFVDNSTFCGQFYILRTVQHFVPTGVRGGIDLVWGETDGRRGGLKGDQGETEGGGWFEMLWHDTRGFWGYGRKKKKINRVNTMTTN